MRGKPSSKKVRSSPSLSFVGQVQVEALRIHAPLQAYLFLGMLL